MFSSRARLKPEAEQVWKKDDGRTEEQSGAAEEGSRRHRHRHGPFLHAAKVIHDRNRHHENRRTERRRARFAELGVHYDRSTDDAVADDSTFHSSSSSERDGVILDALDAIDPKASTLSTLDDIARSIVLPSSFAGRSRTREITLEAFQEDVGRISTQSSTEQGQDGETGHAPRKESGLDRHVKMLLQRRQKMHQKLLPILQAVWSFLKTPLGVLVGIYGFLIVFTGAALVICLAGWVPGNKDLQVEIFSQIINGLFTVMGVGFIPWRLRDTYNVALICHYRNRSNDMRARKGLPPLSDPEDLAFEMGDIRHPIISSGGVEAFQSSAHEKDVQGEQEQSLASDPKFQIEIEAEDEHMLSPKQSARLRVCQRNFAKSCTWYTWTETTTHRPFPIAYAVAIAALTDGNSIFQCLLDGYMWGYATHYHDRPAWSTGTFMPLSFLCSIGGGVLIWLGKRKTKKSEEVMAIIKDALDDAASE
jgi:hypothetical protein